MSRDEPKFRTVKETAKVLRLGLSTTYKAISEGNIKAIRIAGGHSGSGFGTRAPRHLKNDETPPRAKRQGLWIY